MLVLAVWGTALAGAFSYLVGPAILLVLYGIYFGVLGRDLAEVCAERMASTLGVRNFLVKKLALVEKQKLTLLGLIGINMMFINLFLK